MKALPIFLLLLFLGSSALLPQRSQAQDAEIQQLLLNVEKLNQLRSILTDMKKGYEILHTGYNTVKSISEGSFNLHEHFLEGLLAVNPHLLRYQRVGDILQQQQRLVQEYKRSLHLFKHHGNFSPADLTYLEQVYAQLLAHSLRHLDELALVLTAGTLRMSDDERLEAIDRIHAAMVDKLAFLRDFNRQATLLAVQQARERQDVQALQRLYQATR